MCENERWKKFIVFESVQEVDKLKIPFCGIRLSSKSEMPGFLFFHLFTIYIWRILLRRVQDPFIRPRTLALEKQQW